ncbi:MAG: hydrogenase small subunit [Coriobacteriia bacterium]
MAQETRSVLDDALAARGVTRRDFVKYCGTLAAMLGLSEMAAPQIAAAIEKGAALKPAIWLNLGSCTGCTESIAQVDYPDVASIVLDLLSLNYFETVMAAAGEQAEQAKKDTIDKGGYIAIIEGSVMQGADGNTLRIAGKTGTEHLKDVCSNADAIIAVGSCAVDGGWVKAAPNPANATGVKQVAAELGFGEVPLINLPTCPVNPEWIVAMVVDALLIGKLPELDEEGRPTLIYGSTIHDNCPRRGHFENGEFVETFGTPEEAKQWCLYKVGCKGPQTKTNCPNVRWNRRVNWCVESGSPCIGCGNLNWVDRDAPFLNRLADIPLPGIGGVKPDTIGAALGAVAAAGLVVHGVAQVATGRMGHGAPMEKQKKSAKGGDNQ